MLLDMIKKITGQNRTEEVPMEILQVLCDLQTLAFDPPVNTQTIVDVLNIELVEIDDTTAYFMYEKCKIFIYTYPMFENNIYLGDYTDKISMSKTHPDTGEIVDTEPPKDLMAAFQDRVSFLKAARLLAMENQNKIIRSDPGVPQMELDITYLTNF